MKTANDPGEISDLTLAIPTINSARYLDIILKFYRGNGIPVVVFVDDRSDDETLRMAREGASETVVVTNPAGFAAEGLIEQMSRSCRTKWLLRIDDDELPSRAMMEFVRVAIARGEDQVYGFLRHQCAVSKSGRLLAGTNVSPLDHRQWRLYQPKNVRFIQGVHTPGIEWHGLSGNAPADASLIHLDWAVHSYEDRKRKVERYDAHTPNEGTRWRSFYLYEDQAPGDSNFAELALPEFATVALELRDRFRDLCLPG